MIGYAWHHPYITILRSLLSGSEHILSDEDLSKYLDYSEPTEDIVTICYKAAYFPEYLNLESSLGDDIAIVCYKAAWWAVRRMAMLVIVDEHLLGPGATDEDRQKKSLQLFELAHKYSAEIDRIQAN